LRTLRAGCDWRVLLVRHGALADEKTRRWFFGATLGWQPYGNVARAMIANSSTKLGWLAPSPAPAVQTAASAPAATASSDDLQQLGSESRVSQSVDQPAHVWPTADGRQHRQ